MTEIVFLIEEDPEGGYTASGNSIFTEGETLEEIRTNIIDAIECHFEKPEDRPKIIRLHFVREEILRYA